MNRKTIQKDLLVSKGVGQPASDDPSDADRKLSNIRTREVSLVDSAANGRSFLIVKRSDDMNKKKEKALFKGEGDEDKKPSEQSKEEEQKPADAPAENPEESDAGNGDAPAAEGGSEEAVEKSFHDQAESILAEALKDVPVHKALVMDQKAMFMAMSDALMGMAMSMDMIRMDLMSFVGSDGKTAFMGEEVVKAVEELKEAEPELTEEELVEKAGRKMKGKRLAKLKEALGTLESLVKELEGDTNVKKGGDTVSKETKKEDQETKKSAENSSENSTSTETPAAEATTQKEEEVVKAADVQKIVDAAVEKATKPLKEEIEALKSEPAESSTEESDSTEDVETQKGAKKEESIFKGIIR